MNASGLEGAGRVRVRGRAARVVLRLAILLLIVLTHLSVSGAQTRQQPGGATKKQTVAVWTGIIPQGFPGNIYTWRLKDDGTYEEYGRAARTGQPIQQMLTGRWTRTGDRLVLRQDSAGFVFRGVVSGDRYSGTLYLGDQQTSEFCATKEQDEFRNCELDLTS